MFSATHLPDPILASRTITVPLIRTADRQKANIDPLDYEVWPHDRQKLIDDLWSLALAYLPQLRDFDSWVGAHARLSGRNLQPWRASLAIAAWLDKSTIPGLWNRIENLSVAYQNERPDLETFDLTALTIRALINYVANVTNVANVANHTETPEAWNITTSQITEAARALSDESDGEIEPDKVTSQRIGHALKKMRLTKPPRPRGQKSRIWRVTKAELLKWANAYGLVMPIEMTNHMDTTPLLNIGYIGDIGNIGYNLIENEENSNLFEGDI